MKKKIIVLGLGLCILAAACGGKQTSKEDNVKTDTETVTDTEQDADEKEKQGTEEKEADVSGDEEETDTQAGDDQEETSEAQTAEEEEGTELLKAPEVTFTDYSQDIKDEDSGVMLLSVTENCPVISLPDNEAAEEKMNMVFEQQHDTNQAYIEEDTQTARDAYRDLSEEEAASWNGYGYGVTYKVMYASPKILSIEAESYEWQGTPHPNTWTSSYCFDVTTGKLLSLADIFTDKAQAGKIVEQHIVDTITAEPYKDALMEDYESYVSDVLTEDVFYLNQKGLVVICNPYLVTAYVAGIIEIEVPYEDLEGVMNEAYIRK